VNSSWSVYWLPYWVVLLWIGSCALFLGFYLKLLQIIKRPYKQLNLLVCMGLVFTFILMGLQLNEAYSILSGGYPYNNYLVVYLFGPTLLFHAMFTSFLYLVMPRPFSGVAIRNHQRAYP
jgi:hypothetical protein